jgi:hypothetical protein
MNESMPVPPSFEFKDRRNGLIGFGILLIILGCICALFVPLMLITLVWTSPIADIAPDYRAIAAAIGTYAIAAVLFIILGIGSIKARRWARALTLIIAWTWLITGVFGIAFTVLLMPKMFAQMPNAGAPAPDSLFTGVVIFALGIVSIIFLLIPGLLVLFYGSRHVKSTCEACDPTPCWTDACPMPVLALSLFCGLSAVSMLFVMLFYHSMMPFFGHLVTGFPGAAMLLGMMILWSYCAWATYKLKEEGWWVLLIGVVVLMASAAITFMRIDPMEMYRLMGYPEPQIALFRQFDFFSGKFIALLTSLSAVFLIGYLVYVKKYFRRLV